MSGFEIAQSCVQKRHENGDVRRKFKGLSVLLAASAFAVTALFCSVTTAEAQNRTLKLHNMHTGEKITVTFKRSGKFDPRALKALNVFLRDWRRNEPTKMDPRLFDLIWEVYQKTGSNQFINVVSGYRSPTTNNALRSRSKGVAEKSQHMQGKAMDYFIPGVNLAKLREIGMKMQVGGVGYYPNSGSPFVHMDVGGVRAWPRMNRDQLVRLFPDGKTMHIPADGKPLPGYNQAVADYKRRIGSNSIQIADAGETPGKKKGFFATLFGGGDEDEADIVEAPNTQVAAKAPTKPVVNEVTPILASTNPSDGQELIALNAPVPASRPAFGSEDGVSVTQTALVSPARSAAQDALAAVMPMDGAAPTAQSPYVDLAQVDVPVPQLLGTRQQIGEAVLVAAVDTGALPSDMVIPIPGSRPDMPASEDQLAELAMLDNSAPVIPAEKPVELAMLVSKAGAELRAAPALAAPSASMSALNPPVQPLVSADDFADDEADAADDEDLAEIAALDPALISAQENVLSAETLASLSDGLAKKGSRPGKTKGLKGVNPLAGDAKLNQQVLAKWAIAKDLVPKTNEAEKSPRVVAHNLLTPPRAGETSGFKTNVANIDTQRFGGAEDSDIDVSRFATN